MSVRSTYSLITALALLAVLITVVVRSDVNSRRQTVRQDLFRELRPVRLSNCDLQRFGEGYDGGYLLCGNLLGLIEAGYSYGINGSDGWGCDVSRSLKVKVHQYDCFNLRQPTCPGGNTLFHPECVGAVAGLENGRPFDTLADQIAVRSPDARHLVMKMDVEGAEWEALGRAPDAVLLRIDQLDVEFHHNEDPSFVAVVRRLKQFFHVVHVHFNNWSCEADEKPFPAWAFEVLFVNKRLGVVDPSGAAGGLVPPDAPNNPAGPDCQVDFQ
jgi:hypothetical protein